MICERIEQDIGQVDTLYVRFQNIKKKHFSDISEIAIVTIRLAYFFKIYIHVNIVVFRTEYWLY